MKQHLERSDLNGMAFSGIMTEYKRGNNRLHFLFHSRLHLIELFSITVFQRRRESRSLQLGERCASFDQIFSFHTDDIFVDRSSRG